MIAQSAQGGDKVALQVGTQHQVDTRFIALGAPGWVTDQKPSPAVLFEQLGAASDAGKGLWALEVQPLGTYERERLYSFAPVEQAPSPVAAVPVQTMQSVEPVSAQPVQTQRSAQSGVMAALSSRQATRPSVSTQPTQAQPQSQDQPSTQTGVMAAIARRRPKLKERVEQSAQTEEHTTFSSDPPQHTESEKQAGTQPSKPEPKLKVQRQSVKKKAKKKDSGIGY